MPQNFKAQNNFMSSLSNQNEPQHFTNMPNPINNVIKQNLENALKNHYRPQPPPLNKPEFNEKNREMTSEKSFVKRGDLQGPIYDVEHLATFTVSPSLGILRAEDGMRKLRLMEKSQGIWVMDCQLMIDAFYLVVFDKRNGQEVERFPLNLIHDPTSVVSEARKDIYNNILLFTVLEDNKKPSNSPTEMHIFQSNGTHSADIVDEIYRAKDGRIEPPLVKGHFDAYKHQVLPTDEAALHPGRRSNLGQVPHSPIKTYNRHPTHSSGGGGSGIDFLNPQVIENDVQVLNNCFDDIERFVARIQASSEHYKELERRKKTRRNQKKVAGDGMLSMRAQLPPPKDYTEIFQKFKHSFNLLAKLKAYIHDPNAPELIHFLFTPLSLIVNTTKEQPYRGLTKTVWLPLLTRDSKELLLNCLSSKEVDLWQSLGDAWLVTVEEAHEQPQAYGHLENQVYKPTFANGWTPSLNQDSLDTNDLSKLAFAAAMQVDTKSSDNQYHQQQYPIEKIRTYSNTQPQFETNHGSKVTPTSTNQIMIGQHQQNQQQQSNNGKYTNNGKLSSSVTDHSLLPHQQQVPVLAKATSNHKASEQMKNWAIDLCMRGGKVYEVTNDRFSNNYKELTVKSGELVEVLDDKRNWWRLRNFHGQVGHAPVTILRQFEFATPGNYSLNNNTTTTNHTNYEPDKSDEATQLQMVTLTVSSPSSANTTKSPMLLSPNQHHNFTTAHSIHDLDSPIEDYYPLNVNNNHNINNDSQGLNILMFL